MGKKKLTQNQKRRITSNHQRTLSAHRKRKAKDSVEWQDDMLGDMRQGRVVSRYSVHADVEDSTGEVFRCNVRRTIPSLVVGDNVLWREGLEQLQGISGVIEAVEARQNVLARPDYYDGIKPIAANIDRIFVVSALLPTFSTNIIDRYIVICESIGFSPILVLNKIDLATAQQRDELMAQFAIYQAIGYEVLFVSSETGEGIAQFRERLQAGCSILVGQSGVGKSSLLNAVDSSLNLATGAVSETSQLGQHTTTVSRLLRLRCGGEVIDSPGIREFGVWHLDVATITQGYREFQPFLGGCKFRDCTHLADPQCAIRAAVEQGKISRERYDNYHRLITALEENKAQRHFFTDE
ncbi:small ribosomal subunit biogenesis GTPase RsgA [Spirabiliibacterium falconis]|uniref:small ribosomal subunit biogenesis GTPase RsgA n=1 Tax=Spirabiliibacterium falconis TaxID=572023 RepID=UPI001AAC99B0|nr:small ribosomal subunit biogenesis GTPase RsgA [Spirabiliibacterium falconis]MBE2893515.1 small ribosomal subunit biogenesis GTPase RsgA [Spirabiliibacterium falconis]